MTLDNYLLNTISGIWQNQIKQSYLDGLIPSERHLQAEIFYFMKLSLDGYQIYVEPFEFKIKSNPTTTDVNIIEEYYPGQVPDIIITKGNQIVAIVEVKYTPHSHCEYKKDMLKLMRYQNYSDSFSLTVDTSRGEFDKINKINITNETAYLFLGIAKADSGAFELNNWGNINNLIVYAGKVDSFGKVAPDFVRL